MKKYIFLILIFILSASVFSAVRKPLFENFTNANCGPCLTHEPTINAFLNSYSDSITAIRYHMSWPGSDPFYSDNQADNNARRYYYGINSVPHCRIDGEYVVPYPPTGTGLINTYNQAMSQPCYVEILFNADFDPVTLSGTLNVYIIAEQDPGLATYYLFTATISDEVPYGWGYFSKFNQPMRDLFPYSGGWPVSFDSIFPDTVTLNLDFQLDSTWWHYDYSRINIVTWLQSGVLPGKNIYQSAHAQLDLVGVEEGNLSIGPSIFSLNNIYPNPFINTAYIPISFEYNTTASITIYDMTGRVVRTLASGRSFSTGSHELTWDGKNDNGIEVASGMYRIEISAQEYEESKTFVKIR